MGCRLLWDGSAERAYSAELAAVPTSHPGTKVGKLTNAARGTGMVGANAAGLGSKTEGQRDVELVQRGHLAVEPRLRAGTMAIGPAQSRPQMTHPQAPEPAHCIVEPVILEMEPLADAHFGCVLHKLGRGGLGRAVFPQQSEIEVPIVGRPLRLTMSRRGGPGPRQVVEAVPMNSRNATDE